MDTEQVVKSTQEQAAAAWVGYLNQIRIEKLFSALSQQNLNLQKAMDSINDTLKTVHELMQSNRGGERGLHGFIAEISEVGIGNARENIKGNPNIYKWINDNSSSDLLRGTTEIQQKFYLSGGDFSLGAIAKHLSKYPDYLSHGSKYQIPKDQYENIKQLYQLTEKEAYKTLSNSGDGLTINQWKKVHNFFKNNDNISFDDLEPSLLKYDEVQKGTIDKTIAQEKEHLKNVDKQQRDKAFDDNKSTLKEAGKATAVSAVIEGSTAFITCIIRKIKSGKGIKDFTSEDWEEIAKEAGVGTVKGGVRGASIYTVTSAVMSKAPNFYDAGICKEALTAYNKTASTTANAVVTASFGFAEQVHKFRKNEITELELLENSQIVCLDASVSALSSLIGQIVIPVPVLGAVIGNAVGTMMYKIAKDNFSKKEQAIMKQYYDELIELNNKLDKQYQQFVLVLSDSFEEFLSILEKTFSPDINVALDGSIELAKACGVDENEILDTKEKAFAYFLD